MPINTAKIDEQIRKLQELKRLASDPEMAPLLESLFVSSSAEQQHVAAESVSVASPNGSRKGDVVKAAEIAVQRLGFEGHRFKRSDLFAAMEQNDFQFAAVSPHIAVNGALRKLVERGVIRIAVKGSGRAGHQYEWVVEKELA